MSPKEASSSLCGCWCAPFAPSPHWSCYSGQPAPQRPKQVVASQSWQHSNGEASRLALAIPCLRPTSFSRFHGGHVIMSYSESWTPHFEIMSSYTLQLGPVQPCSGPGKVTHVIMSFMVLTSCNCCFADPSLLSRAIQICPLTSQKDLQHIGSCCVVWSCRNIAGYFSKHR